MVKHGLTMSNHHFWWDSDDEPFLRSNEFYQPTIVTRYSYNYLQLPPNRWLFTTISHAMVFPWISHVFSTFFQGSTSSISTSRNSALRATRSAASSASSSAKRSEGRVQVPVPLKRSAWRMDGIFRFSGEFHGIFQISLKFSWEFDRVSMGFWEGFLWDFDAI